MRKPARELGILLLLACTAATWWVSFAAAEVSPSSAAPAPADDQDNVYVLPRHPIRFPEIPLILRLPAPPQHWQWGKHGEVRDCWVPLHRVENCVQSVKASFHGGQVRLGPQCCRAIDGLGAHCHRKVFASPHPGHAFPHAIKHFCAQLVPRSPSSGAAPTAE